MRKILATTTALLIALSACGGGDSSSDTTTPDRNAFIPSVALSGKLVDVTTLKPLKGVQVTGYSYQTKTSTSATTDAYGKFSMTVQGDEFGLQIAATSTHCGGFVRTSGISLPSLNGVATNRDNSNTFTAGDRGSIGVYKNGAAACP